MSHVADNAAAPGDLDGVLADLLHRAVAAHVEEVGLQVLAVTAGLSAHQEQRTSEIPAEFLSLPGSALSSGFFIIEIFFFQV